ncbi:MAG TPA: DUF4386 domain-containing protein [Woeseiaceae bacterium]|nr:DUF4386 domain-containing protein [Woeseiaceae bacterium]
MIIAGGVSFVLAALAFVLVFAYLAANFEYPDILEGSASDVLPRLHAGGTGMRAVWAVYAFLPLLLVPGAVGTVLACRSSPGRMRLALVLASIAAFSMCLGLMRWPSIHWALAEAHSDAGPDTQSSIEAIFNGLNLYLGNYIGEFLGEVALATFFLLAGFSFLDEARFPKWLGWSGVVFAVLFGVGALRNVTTAVQVIADLNNALLPLMMIALGVMLVRYAIHPDPSGDIEQRTAGDAPKAAHPKG